MTRKHYRIVSALVVALVGTAIAAPAAGARPVDQVQVRLNPDEQTLIAAASQEATQASPVRPNPDQLGGAPRYLPAQQLAELTRPQVVQATSGSGFDWGDAGIGAAVMFGLTMVGVGTAVVLNARRRRATAIG
jgi:hypothetical protein